MIARHGLEEDLEHVIIPHPDGRSRIFLLKRKFLRIVYSDGHFADYPLEEIIEATVRYPELLLSEALFLFHEEMDAQIREMFEKENNSLDG